VLEDGRDGSVLAVTLLFYRRLSNSARSCCLAFGFGREGCGIGLRGAEEDETLPREPLVVEWSLKMKYTRFRSTVS
jgi:hypothetical protein